MLTFCAIYFFALGLGVAYDSRNSTADAFVLKIPSTLSSLF
jgi:hypothetical protein